MASPRARTATDSESQEAEETKLPEVYYSPQGSANASVRNSHRSSRNSFTQRADNGNGAGSSNGDPNAANTKVVRGRTKSRNRKSLDIRSRLLDIVDRAQ